MHRIYADASVAEASVVGLGYVIEEAGDGDGGEVLEKGIKSVPKQHPRRGYLHANAAEFEAVIAGVRRSLDYTDGDGALLVYTDSKTVLDHLTGRDGIKYDKRFVHAALSFLGRYDHWNVSWLPRDHNEEADGLARKARVFGEQDYTIDVGSDVEVTEA